MNSKLLTCQKGSINRPQLFRHFQPFQSKSIGLSCTQITVVSVVSNCMTLGKFFILSVPQFFDLQNGDN